MKATYFTAAAALALTLGIAACSGEAPPPAPTPAPTPSPAARIAAPPPAPVVTEPTYENYLDAPQTSGTWTYLDEPGETLAMFGVDPERPAFAVRCANGRVELGRITARLASGSRTMRVTSETTTRQLEAVPKSGKVAVLVAGLNPNDPLLDAMAITKGRFKIAVEGERTLYLPAWAEVTRVIEDCR